MVENQVENLKTGLELLHRGAREFFYCCNGLLIPTPVCQLQLDALDLSLVAIAIFWRVSLLEFIFKA